MAYSVVRLNTLGLQAKRMGHAMAEAFRDEPNFNYMLPDLKYRTRSLAWFFGSFVASLGIRYGAVYTTPGGDGGAVWFRPGQVPSFWGSVRAGLFAMPFHLGLGGTHRSAALGGKLERLRAEVAPPWHWYLAALGVDPTAQGHGLGTALLQPVFDRADADGTPCYLETFRERTAAYYGRLGFVVIHQDAVSEGPPFWCMVREPDFAAGQRTAP